MRIGIVGAMDIEITLIKEKLMNLINVKDHNIEILFGNIGNN